ncbi:MAG: bifunctional serine/threonine-protein kinase/formylglycine-generating enzyme family protein [Acidobacteriota bacterium]
MPSTREQDAARGRDLLFAVIALQVGFVTQAQFVEVMRLMPGRPGAGAARLFVERGYLGTTQVAAISTLMEARLAMHDGDVAQSIAAQRRSADVGASLFLLELPEARDAAPATIFARPPAAPERYTLQGELGRGGLGRVVLALDGSLMGREVAMKLLREDHAARSGNDHLRDRFVEEAQITAQLSHPNIVAVHELGVTRDGEPYYTMPVITGRTLSDEIRSVHAGLADGRIPPEAWGVERLKLVSAYIGLCHAISYAHARGVIHRDVKPPNVMLGEHGETVVLDWGLAKLKRQGAGSPPGTRAAVATARAHDGSETVEGAVTGTPSYMAPEQAAGHVHDIDERSDIYSLGAVLFEILTGRPPFDGVSPYAILCQVLEAEVPDPRSVAPVPVPDDLAVIVLRAMAREKALRYESVKVLLDDVVLAVEGTRERERRQAEVRRIVAAADERARCHAVLGDEQRRIEALAREEGRKLKGAEPVSEKAAWWKLEDSAKAAGRETLRSFADAERLYHQALELDRDCPAARAGLADLYRARLRSAEESEDDAGVQYYSDMVRTYDNGRYARELSGTGTIAIATEPPGAEVYLYRYEEHERRLVPVPWSAPGSGPSLREGEVATAAGTYLTPRRDDAHSFLGDAPAAVEAPMGSYVVIARLAGFHDLGQPIHVGRNENVRVLVRLAATGDVPDGLLLVPGGAFVAGGPSVYAPRPRRTIELPDFFIGRFPVTCAEYLAFLNDVGAVDAARARRHAPRWQDGGSLHWSEGPEGTFRLPESDPGAGVPALPDGPVTNVSWHDANAYCAWRSEKEGRPFRLPTEDEWEKAARGVDGRVYPWGNHFDASWCNTADSHLDGRGGLRAVGAFPVDDSPYGIRGLGGNVCDWCADVFREDLGWRALRGGFWNGSGAHCQANNRFGSAPSDLRGIVGFRVALSRAVD